MKLASSIFFPVAFAASALAHGLVTQITVDGKVFKGNDLNGKDPSIIRLVSTTSPVKGASNPDMNCGAGSPQPAADIANAMPGSQLGFFWGSGFGGNWPHTTGPIMTYMASCGSTTCDKFDSTQAKWFKIDQQGQKDGGSGWFQADVAAGQPANVTLPSNLAPGNYLIRHELIGLQGAVSQGGAEFYPSCSQFTVGGSQTGAPTNQDLVSFPGAYSDNDPGILVPDVFNPGFTYVFPGPPIASFISGSSSSGGSPTNGTSASGTASGTTSGTTTTSAPTATSTKSTCKLIRKAKASSTSFSAVPAASTILPRHFSRIMRGLIANHAVSF